MFRNKPAFTSCFSKCRKPNHVFAETNAGNRFSDYAASLQPVSVLMLTKSNLVWQVVGERSEPAATKMHLWLERTAFYKVPKSHQDEVAEQCRKPFEQVECPRFPTLHGRP